MEPETPDIVKTTIRVPREVLHAAQYMLKDSGKSVNQFVVDHLIALVEKPSG